MGRELIRRISTSDAAFEEVFDALETRRTASADEIDRVVDEILRDVRQRGDDAVLDAIERFDGYRLTPAELELDAAEIATGAAALDTESREALQLAGQRIRAFHEVRIPETWSVADGEARLGQQVRPLRRVGLYVPGGNAPLASTVLMLGLPARVAGVKELIMASPGRQLHPALLEAARLVGVDRVFRIGGAQAIAALAYGTASVPRVDKIVGPGNAYVQAAKRLVFGQVAIDGEAGPSEVLILADDAADPAFVAADLLAQAEHDERASVVLSTPGEALARAVALELERRLPGLPLEDVARRSLAGLSALIVTRDLEEALALANRYAPEHLQLMLRDPEPWLGRIENAGAIFVGDQSPVPVGDYVAGPSHVLPTGGTARFFSVVGVEDFVKRISLIEISEVGMRKMGPVAVRLAEMEGLEAHGRALRLRLDRNT